MPHKETDGVELNKTQLIKESIDDIRNNVQYMRDELIIVKNEVGKHRDHVDEWALRMDSNYLKSMNKISQVESRTDKELADIRSHCAGNHGTGTPQLGFKGLQASGRFGIIALCSVLLFLGSFLGALAFILLCRFGPNFLVKIFA